MRNGSIEADELDVRHLITVFDLDDVVDGIVNASELSTSSYSLNSREKGMVLMVLSQV